MSTPFLVPSFSGNFGGPAGSGLFLLVAALFLLSSEAALATTFDSGGSDAPSDSSHLPLTRQGLRLALTGPQAAVSSPERSPPGPPNDRWLGRDKAKHVTVSALWTLSTQYVLVNRADWTEPDALPASIASAATVGLTKEFYDASDFSGHFCGRDLVADAVGIGLAVGLITL